jgi:hypothetical protein
MPCGNFKTLKTCVVFLALHLKQVYYVPHDE